MQNLKSKIYNLLRRSEKYTKTDMVYLTKGSFWLTFGQVITSVVIFALSIGYANLIPKETYGIYKYVISVAGLLAIFSLRGMSVPVIQAVARGYEGVLIPALKTKIKWGALGSMGCIGVAFYYYFQSDTTLFIAFLLAAAFLPFMESFGIFDNFLQGKKLFKDSQIYESISQISAAAIMFMVLALSGNLYYMLLAYFGSWTLLHIFFFAVTVRKNRPSKNYDPKTIPYGKQSSLVNIIDAAMASLDSMIIFHYLGPVQVALYSFALAPISQIKGMFGQIPVLALPKLSGRSVGEIEPMLKKRMFYLFLFGGAVSLFYILISPHVFKIFFPKYLDSVFFTQLFSLSIPLALPQYIWGSAINSKFTIIPKKMLYLWNIPSVVFIVSALLLIKKFGITGVVLGRLFSLTFAFILYYVIWQKIKKLDTAAQYTV